jgi:hypothetical protein
MKIRTALLILLHFVGIMSKANPLYFQTYDQVKQAQKSHDEIVQSTYRQMQLLQRELDQHHQGANQKCSTTFQRWMQPAHACDQWLIDEADFEQRLKVAERRFVDSKMYLHYLEKIDDDLSHDLANAQIQTVIGHLEKNQFELLSQLAQQQREYRKWNESYSQTTSMMASSWKKSVRQAVADRGNINALGLSDLQLKQAYTLIYRDRYLQTLRQASDVFMIKFAKPVESFQKGIMDFQQAVCQQAEVILDGPQYLKMTSEVDHYLRTIPASRSANPDCQARPVRQIPGQVL